MTVFLSSFLLCSFLTWLSSKLFRSWRFLDQPERFGYARAAIPHGVGIVLFVTFFLLGLFFLSLSSKVLILFFAGAVLTLTSFLDDRTKLSPFLRLFIQALCALLIVLAGVQVPAISNPFGSVIVLDQVQWTLHVGGLNLMIAPLAVIAALLWIVFVTNAMNWLDGSPGIVSGVSTIAALVIYLLAAEKNIHIIDQSTLATMALLISGASLAFVFFEFPPPTVLMGDSGTMFLGFMLSTMAIFSGAKFATVFIVLAIPLFDALWTIGRRILQKKSPFRGDFQHFHHELLRSGLAPWQVNIFYYVISLGFGITALYLNSVGKMIVLATLFLFLAVVRTKLRTR